MVLSYLLQLNDTEEKVVEFTAILQEQIEQRCQCGFIPDHITEGAFQCLGDPDHVTFRARIHIIETAVISELITSIEDWIEDPVTTIIIDGLRLRLDQNCPIVIESVNDPGCGSESDSGSSGSDNTGTIIGGVVAVVIVIAVTVIVIVIAVLYFKSWRQTERKITGYTTYVHLGYSSYR